MWGSSATDSNCTFRILDHGTTTKTQTFGYPTLSNLIGDEDTGGVITRTFTHDAAGNMTKDVRGATTYDYAINNAGRISQVKINTVVKADYEYNARNQLVLRSTTVAGGPSGDVHLIYDRQGHLIAEADAATGTTFREYVWLADMPLAVVADVDTASPVIYYVHVDHLNRPVMMTDSLKANVWEAVWLPYGAAHAITGAAANDARFPGQWFQIETGLHYNWHRHYDPTLARYTQPDPLGFVDGPSVFAYAKNSPQVYVDRDGRFVGPLIQVAARVAPHIVRFARQLGARIGGFLAGLISQQNGDDECGDGCERDRKELQEAVDRWVTNMREAQARRLIQDIKALNDQVETINNAVSVHNQRCPANQVDGKGIKRGSFPVF